MIFSKGLTLLLIATLYGLAWALWAWAEALRGLWTRIYGGHSRLMNTLSFGVAGYFATRPRIHLWWLRTCALAVFLIALFLSIAAAGIFGAVEWKE